MCAALVVLGVLAGCGRHDDAASPARRTVCITGYNEYTRKLHEFWLDNEHRSGCFGNPSAREAGEAFGGGGGFACGCQVTPGQAAKLAWVFAQPLDEIERGVAAEHRTIDVALSARVFQEERHGRTAMGGRHERARAAADRGAMIAARRVRSAVRYFEMYHSASALAREG